MGLVSEAFEKESWPLQSNIQDNNLGFWPRVETLKLLIAFS
jgi:hypothetical protein